MKTLTLSMADVRFDYGGAKHCHCPTPGSISVPDNVHLQTGDVIRLLEHPSFADMQLRVDVVLDQSAIVTVEDR